MSRRSRSGQLELNFDGLTDSVTNLAGSLILLVLLVLAITAPPTPGAMVSQKPERRDRSIETLQRELLQIEASLRSTSAKIQQLDTEVSELERQVEELEKASTVAQPLDPNDEI